MSDLLVERQDGVLRLTLNRPERLNAITSGLADALREAILGADDDDAIRAVLLRANGRGFCAGQDLAEPLIAAGSDLGIMIERHYNPLIRAMRALPKPIVAAVNGVAAGAGANLAFACDIVVAARSATFIESFARIGLLPDSGGTWMLPRLVGHARATALAMLADKVSADQAQAWGAIWQAVDDTELAASSEQIALRLASAPTRALGAIKSALAQSWTGSLDDALERERDLQRELGESADYREGVTAFGEKRAPRFEGR